MSADMDIFSVIPAPIDLFTVYLNTGTLFDLACGTVIPCQNNYVVNGGMSNILGIAGKSQTYKSTVLESFMARAMSIYTNTRCAILDSENNKTSTTRYDHFAINGVKVSDRISLYDTTTDDLNTFHDKISSVVDYKVKHAKDLMVETPFLDKNGKPIMMITPTFMGIDSFTACQTESTSDAVEDTKLDDSSLNTVWMKSGKNKTLFMRQLVQYARKANIYFFLTAHVGENKDLGAGPYAQPTKQFQFFAQKEKLKDVGSQFEFLTNTFLKTGSASVMQNQSDRTCLYPADFSTAAELNKVNVTVVRNKINASGLMIPFVVSQYKGIMNILTHLQYLKDQKEEVLLQQRGANMSAALYPNTSFTRNTIREKSEADYKLERAIDLSAQFIYIKNCWTSFSLPVDISDMTTEMFVTGLTKDSAMINDILESRSYWTYNKHDLRPMLSIFDIIEMIKTGKKPAGKPVSVVPDAITPEVSETKVKPKAKAA